MILGLIKSHKNCFVFFLVGVGVHCPARPPFYGTFLAPLFSCPLGPLSSRPGALAEQPGSAARSGVSLFEGQELPARLLSPAHDNNTSRGKIPLVDDGDKKKKNNNQKPKLFRLLTLDLPARPAVPGRGLHGAEVTFITA